MSGYGGRFTKGKVTAFVLTGFGTRPAAIPIETVSLEAERPQPEADNSSPSCVEIKVPPAPHIHLFGLILSTETDLLSVLVYRFIDLNLFKINVAMLTHLTSELYLLLVHDEVY